MNYFEQDSPRLFQLIARGETSDVEEELRLPSALWQTDRYRRTALHVAALYGKTEVVRMLLSRGADVNAPNSIGVTPLKVAVQNGYHQIAVILISAGADPNAKLQRKEGDTLLTGDGVLHGVRSVETATALFYAGVTGIDDPNVFGRTALHVAIVNGYVDVAICLLDKGARFDTRDRDGKTPLDAAEVALSGEQRVRLQEAVARHDH
jgi:ankyrin repeat protein